MGSKSWFVDLEIIIQGSTEQGFQGGYYFWSMRLHKEAFEATAQTKLRFFIENFESNGAVLFINLIELRKSSLPVLIEEIMEMDTFKGIMQHTVSTMSTESQITIKNLKSVPIMQAIVSAVREGDLKRNFSAEQEILKLMFAFDRINYSTYNTCDHVYLNN